MACDALASMGCCRFQIESFRVDAHTWQGCVCVCVIRVLVGSGLEHRTHRDDQNCLHTKRNKAPKFSLWP